MPKNDIEALILALKDYKDEELFEIEESGLILRGIRPKEKDKEYDTVAFYTYADYPYLASNMVFKTKEGKYIVERNTDPGGEDTMKYFELTIK